MIAYQLSNGRTVYLTIDELLNLTHEEEQYLISHNYGEVLNNPFIRSAGFSKKNSGEKEAPEVEDDYSLDDALAQAGIEDIDTFLDIDDFLPDDVSD